MIRTMLGAFSAILFLSCSGSVASRSDNTTREHAQSILPDTLIHGSAAYGVRSYFRFTIDEETLLSATIQRGERISLSIEGDGVIKRIATMTDGPEAIPNLYLTNGVYYLVIERAYGGTTRESAYELSLLRKRISASAEREDNGDAARAQELLLPAVISGYYAPAMDPMHADAKPAYAELDWYRINGTESESVFDIELSPVPGINGVMRIIDDAGTVILSQDGGEAGEGESLPGILLPAGAVRYLVISTARQSSSRFPYQLRVTAKPYSLGYAYEPNNNASQAVALQEGMPVRGRIDSARDVEMFRLPDSTDAGVQLRAPSDIALSAVLLNEAQEVVTNYTTPSNSADIIIPPAGLSVTRFIALRGIARVKGTASASRNQYEVIFSRAIGQ